MPARRIEHISFQIDEAAGKIRWGDPTRVGMQAKPIKQVDNVLGETHADGHVANRVFEDEIPTNDPGDEFAHGGVRVGIGAARDRNHGGELRITDGCETADNAHQNERKGYGRTSAGTPEGSRMVNK